MMQLLRIRFGRRLARVINARDDDRGMALATVIILGAVLLMMSVTIVSVSVSGNSKAHIESNWVAAGQAAYAGVEDYQSKLANDNTYTQYGSTGSTFSAGSTFTSTDGNPAFGLGAKGTSATWQPVDPTNPNGASYRYQVDNSHYTSTGIVRLQSTGRVGTTTRTIVANLKQSGFLNYLYFTDYEITDPVLTPGCTAAYQWAVSSRPNCGTIQFAATDTIQGPVHSNDTMYICGTTFTSTVTTSSTVAGGYLLPSGCTISPTFQQGSPSYTPVIQFPSTIGSLIQETRSDLKSSTVPNPGCLYTGPTTFKFNGNGTWTVYSPWTQKTNIAGSPATQGSINPQCGTPGYSASGNTLGSPGGQTFTVVPNNLVYVQNVPTSSTDPNYPSSSWTGGLPPHYACTGADGKTAGNGVGYPAVNETPPTSTSYVCTNGDAFVQGGFGGNATIAASNYLYITGDITYDNPATDLLGLIGQNNVYVYNPIGTYTANGTTYTNALLDETPSNRTIDAAIMSVAHSFAVENYTADSYHPKGYLNVDGAIVQKFRGAVATAGPNGQVATGYTKNYVYDSRLAYEAPPDFLSPVSTTYSITQVSEARTAFSWTGDSE